MISIIIPVYNGEEFLEETYSGIAASKEQDFEVIFVDDGSKDRSAEIIRRLAENDGRVFYFYKENGGIASARNYGLEKARGKYVCFVDQDDCVKEDMLSVLLQDIEGNAADIVRAGTNEVIAGVESAVCEKQECRTVTKKDEIRDFYLQALILRGVAKRQEYIMPVNIWGVMFRMDFLRENRIRFCSFCDYEDDWIFCIQAFKAAETFCIEKKTLYSWKIHPQSESHNRIVHDHYIEELYKKHKEMQRFLMDACEGIALTENEKYAFGRELQKQRLLWSLSNETGRGIRKHSLEESTAIMRSVMQEEKKEGIFADINKYPLSTTGHKINGIKKQYHLFREYLLTFLLIHNMEKWAVFLNKKFLHGRWHN